MGPLFSHAKWTCELAIKWTQRQKSTGKSPLFSRSTVHGPRPHFIDTREISAFSKIFGRPSVAVNRRSDGRGTMRALLLEDMGATVARQAHKAS